jgi:hypothetical protein
MLHQQKITRINFMLYNNVLRYIVISSLESLDSKYGQPWLNLWVHHKLMLIPYLEIFFNFNYSRYWSSMAQLVRPFMATFEFLQCIPSSSFHDLHMNFIFTIFLINLITATSVIISGTIWNFPFFASPRVAPNPHVQQYVHLFCFVLRKR